MNSSLHEAHFYASGKTFLHASISLFAGIVTLVVAAFVTGSVDMLLEYTNALIRNVEPQLEVAYVPNAVLFGLLLDALIGIAVSLLVFNRLHFHSWLPRKHAAQ
jgi:hypothetical protein